MHRTFNVIKLSIKITHPLKNIGIISQLIRYNVTEMFERINIFNRVIANID